MTGKRQREKRDREPGRNVIVMYIYLSRMKKSTSGKKKGNID